MINSKFLSGTLKFFSSIDCKTDDDTIHKRHLKSMKASCLKQQSRTSIGYQIPLLCLPKDIWGLNIYTSNGGRPDPPSALLPHWAACSLSSCCPSWRAAWWWSRTWCPPQTWPTSRVCSRWLSPSMRWRTSSFLHPIADPGFKINQQTTTIMFIFYKIHHR